MEDQILNLKKQVEEKQEVLKEITDIKNTQNKMIIDMKEENSKLKKEFNVKDNLINELNNRIDSKDSEIQKISSEMN